MKTLDLSTPTFAIQRSAQRAFADHGWLKARHSFSFADYVDPENLNWGALRVFNDDRIAGGAGFPPHSHGDMEIVTYVFSGALAHKDNMGNEGVVKSGGIQFMSAGTGVTHSEFNALPDTELHLVQMWVMPGQRGVQPSYGQLDPTIEDRRNKWLTPVSGRRNVDAQIRITQDASLHLARLEGVNLVHAFDPKRYGFLFVGEGKVEANGETLSAGDAVRLYDVPNLSLTGHAEVVLWDLPAA
ncbi:MAG TPA: pirin family protein [Verrucomicrobiae bacterium]|jgi:redox-sensitive bicupin YhaK (pirin superfamily)|nr:pirin family protein [Verrucomicrobiae bacterium]